MKELLLQGIYFSNESRTVLFYSIIALTIVSTIYPWQMKGVLSRLLLHLPILVGVLYGNYESLVPRQENIRVDALVLIPCVGLALGIYIVKLVFVGRAANSR